jgi:drug/metabolite transporter (DMT)-like permease
MSGFRHPSHTTAIGIALFVTLLWSSSWILIRWGLDGEGLPPLTFAALRYALAATIVVAWVRVRQRIAPKPTALGRGTILGLVSLGITMYTLTQGAQYVAIDNQPAATTTLVLSLTPLFVAGLSVVSLREIPSWRQLIGTVLVAAGAYLYFAGDLGATTLGMIAAGLGLASNVAAALLGRHMNRTALLPPAVVTGYSMAVGSALLIVIGITVEGVPAISAKAWLIIGWLALVNTALAFTLWNLSLRQLSAIESASINNTMLIQIALLAWIFLSEPLGAPELAGITLVTVGVVLTQRLRPNTART